LCVVALAPRLWRAPWTAPRRDEVFLCLWLVGGCAGVASAKSFYDHYFLQLLPVLSVIAGWWLAAALTATRGWQRPSWPLALPGAVAVAVAVAAFLLLPAVAAMSALHGTIAPLMSFQGGTIAWHRDSPARIAADLAGTELPAGAGLKIYVFDGQPIIYALARQSPPTRYVLPSVLTKNFLEHVAGIDATREVAGILARRPGFIVRDRHPPVNPKTVNQTVYLLLDQTLAAHYSLWRSYGDMDVYALDP
jgi:4-amino-4-deoxy-L-arabinose transferase-like glycosyltransferase